MSTRKRQLQTFLIEEDERDFSHLLCRMYPDVVFLDDNVWDGGPHSVTSIEKCISTYCYIWNKAIFPELPIFVREDGRLEGPASGVVIQFQRSRIDEEGDLLSGRIAVGYDTSGEEFCSFVDGVWKILKKVSTVGVCYAPTSGPVDFSRVIGQYVVGLAAREAFEKGRLNRLRHTSTYHYFVPRK